ncbi:MAG: hypothetical protein SPL22_07050 [Treponema sp.]|uniref:outer membrane beta-barrel protein n=1 Tax=Treponema sp. TaxID=166 RepID=UPI002A90AF98|nr:outer membrane beta-barrel protein [Treponema sp.]MDY6397474.1 hypothetical protein [Treponema sp.]
MKKLIAVSAVAALAATALSAEITFGSWGRSLWTVAANGYDATDDSDQIVTDIHQSWGGDAPRTALAVNGSSDNIGFALDIHGNGKGINQGDNAYIWAKPIDQVKVYMGKLDVNVLRGDGCFGLWNWDRIGCVDGSEGWTFADYLDAEGFGVSVVATPTEGLTLGAGIPLECGNGGDVKKDGTHTLSGVYAHRAAYVGAYAIEGVGTIKAALKTLPKTSDDKSQTEVAAAFDLTAVENLFVSLGARINTNSDVHDKAINAYARYGVNEQLTVHAIVGTKLSAVYIDKDKGPKDDGFGFIFGAGVDYALDGGIGLFADVRYANGIYKSASNADNTDSLTLGAGVTKGFSNGVIGIAFEGATNNGGRYALKKNDDGVANKFSWEIPVKFEYWF